MKTRLYNSLIAFFGGLFGVNILFVLFYLIPFENLFPPTPLGNFLFTLIVVSFIEEGAKFLLIKRDIGQFPYGFLLGFGFGVGETILKHPFFISGVAPKIEAGAILLHSVTAGIICYFVKKNRPVLGFLIAIIIHTGYNLLIDWVVQ